MGEWNSWCSGEMRRYQEEHLWCRRLSGQSLTLRHESVGKTGLDTLVVHALNDAYLVWVIHLIRAGANALNMPPGEYGRKAETQRN